MLWVVSLSLSARVQVEVCTSMDGFCGRQRTLNHSSALRRPSSKVFCSEDSGILAFLKKNHRNSIRTCFHFYSRYGDKELLHSSLGL